MINMHTKFEVSSLSRSRYTLGVLKFKMDDVVATDRRSLVKMLYATE